MGRTVSNGITYIDISPNGLNRYEDGNLVENLNDTTSLTYELMKPTATSK